MPRDESFSSHYVPIRNRPNDLGDRARREIDPHDRASLRDVHMRRRMIQGVDSHLEARLTEHGRHPIIPKALGYFKPLSRAADVL